MKNTSNYNAWKINEKDFPSKGTIEDKIKFIISYGILAPSTHNTQPWKFKINKNKLLILPDWKYKLPYGDPDNSNLYFSLGCCTQNIHSAAANFKLRALLKIIENKNEPIEITFSNHEIQDNSSNTLFPFIKKRFSNKFQYDGKKINPGILNKLLNLQVSKDLQIKLFDNAVILHEIAMLQKEAVLTYISNSYFKRELADWMRPNDTKENDGMPGFLSGLSNAKVKIGKILLRFTPIIIKSHAKKDSMLISTSSAVGCIISKTDKYTDWINSGITYQKLALTATGLGIQSTILAAMVEDKESNRKLKKLLKLEGNIQIFFRLGFNNISGIHSPRRVPSYV